jgi:hypothetical protein
MWDNRGQLIGHLIMLGKTELPSKNESSMPGQLSIPHTRLGSFNLGVYLPIPCDWRVTWLRNSGYE